MLPCLLWRAPGAIKEIIRQARTGQNILLLLRSNLKGESNKLFQDLVVISLKFIPSVLISLLLFPSWRCFNTIRLWHNAILQRQIRELRESLVTEVGLVVQGSLFNVVSLNIASSSDSIS